MAISSLAQEMVATRVGCFSMVVSPKACLMVTGNCELLELEVLASDVEDAGPVEQAVRVSAAAARTAVALPADLKSVRRVALGPKKRGEVTELLR
jgi:ribosomal protein S7